MNTSLLNVQFNSCFCTWNMSFSVSQLELIFCSKSFLAFSVDLVYGVLFII